jgi:hypothetical protein
MRQDALFERVCSVIVGTLRVDGLRVVFRVDKSTAKEPNTLDLQVTNLSEQSRAAMQRKGLRVQVLAGYAAQAAVIFTGDLRTADHVHAGTEWTTKITAGDGERAYQHDHVSESFAPNTPAADVVRRLVRRLGVDPGEALQVAATLQGAFEHGFVAHGKVSAVLDRVLGSRGMGWSVQDGRLQLLRPGETAPGSAVVLSPDAGLVGSPEAGTPAVKGGPAVLKARSLLQPTLRPGGLVDLRSAAHRGQFRVEKVTHTGDTAGGDWYSDVELRAL